MTKKSTKKDFKIKMIKYVGHEYELIGDFKNLNTKVEFLHIKCNNHFYATPNNFIYKHCRCPICRDNQHAKSPEKFSAWFSSNVGNTYTLLTPYVRSHVKVKVMHNKCKHTYEVTPHDFKSGKRCPYCYGNIRKTTAEFKKQVEALTDKEYELKSPYKNNRYKVVILHKKCGRTYKVSPHDFLTGKTRCPYCNQSHGEKLIEHMLIHKNIKYVSQKVFKDCTTGVKNSYLKFDFYLPDENALIEYDGIQHFKPIPWFGGKSQFVTQQFRDNVKNSYAEDNNIPIIRIPYTLDDASVAKELNIFINYCKAKKSTPKSRFMI